VRQLVNSEGNLLSSKEFLSLYKVSVTPKDFGIVLNGIPSGDALLFRKVSRPDPQLRIDSRLDGSLWLL
jgi:hypothetical protein